MKMELQISLIVWRGKDHTTRQKILKDSRLGTYGVLALMIVIPTQIFTYIRIRLALHWLAV